MAFALPTLPPAWAVEQGGCPHVVRRTDTYECGVIHRTSSREVCDSASLEKWCLHPEKHKECVFYRGHANEKRRLSA